MLVVFHRSAGKMILKGLVAALVVGLAWTKSVAAATSYSNVYVQSGPGLASIYGPAVLRGAQLAPLATAPLMSSLLPPCVSPCIVGGQQIAAIAPVATSSSNFVSYNPPASVPVSVPMVVAPANDDSTNYEYSYVVYDENTGDQKAQQELSDGSVVRGQYSLIQPDGYVREVQYTADDLRGFNAVVKNFLPEFELNTASGEKPVPPCPEVKSEPLKESPEGESKGEAHDLVPEGHGGETKEEHEAHVEPVESEKKKPEEPESHEEHKETESHEQPEKSEKPQQSGNHEEHESHEEQEEPKKKGGSEQEPSKEEPGSHEESHSEEGNANEEKNQVQPRSDGGAEQPNDINALVSYNDIIKCIQAAIKGVNPQPSASPLTYIVLNKPC